MADQTISTQIVANADFSALIADVHKVTASLSRLQEQLATSNKMLANQIAVMNRSFSDTLRSTGQFSTHFVSLQSDVEKFGKNLDGGKLKLGQYFNTFREHARTSGGVIRDLAKQQVALQNAVLQPLGKNAQGLMQFNVHVPRGLDEIKNKTAIARQELQIMNKVIQDGAGQLINWGKNTQWAGRQLTVGLTVPLAAFGKAAADAFKQADQELVRLTKVYGDVAGTSAEELGRVRKEVTQTAKDISAAMGVSFKETIALAADIAATGKTGDELLGSIQETTRLAVLGEVDRQDAMKATLAIQTAFKQNTDELSNSINFLNAVENQTSTTLNDLVEAIPKAGPVVKALGGDVQDLALYLTAMREGGINASEGANAIKSSLASLINPTKVAKEMFNGLGIDLEKIVQGNAGNITATIMELQSALNQLDPLSKTQAIEQLFGKFQFARLSALFENLGKEGSQTLQVLDLMKASSEELATVASRELSAVTESASGKYRRALESLKASLAEVGEQFLTINTILIEVINKVVNFASNLPGPVKQILGLLGGITAIAGPLIMITGVLANFFGYIMKGVFHMKAFFKGGEGWKYLTPEILAAEKAGKLVEQSFYSDAKAAAVLQQALRNLIDEFSVLEAKAKSGALSVNPAVQTMAGNLVMAGGGRVVNPNHPLAGTMGTRASTHMVARSGMTEAQRLQQTMFGMVPGSGPVNQKIGQSPQIYMNDALPNVPGLTTVGGVSTGVVAGEAAKWHAMMATLGMQSKAEIESLKKTIVATGTVNKEFMNQFDDVLPVVSKITDNAARQSALIVAELRAGKLTVESAKAKIVALNLETERMIASSMQAQATSMGRTLNPTMVPTLNQPVVDPTGKSNMRELFKKGRTRDFINKVAGTLGVRTSGAGYNIETTVPRKMNMGGYVYTMNDGNIVPGPNVNRDVVPAVLTPGEFVVNREATQANLPLLTAINNGYNNGGEVRFERGHVGPQMGAPKSGISNLYAGSGATSHVSQGIPIWMTSTLNQETRTGRAGLTGSQVHAEFTTALKNGRHPFEPLITAARSSGMPGEEGKILAAFDEMMNDLKGRNSKTLFVGGTANSFEKYFTRKVLPRFGRNFQNLFMSFGTAYGQRGSRDMVAQGNVSINQKTGKMSGITGRGNPLARGISSSIIGSASGGGFGAGRARLSSSLASAAMAIATRGRRRNMGGMIPGYNMGGLVPSATGNKYNMGGMVQGYQDGGPVYGPKRPNILQSARSKGFFGQSLTRPSAGGGMSPMAGIGVGMGMQFAGQAIGGTTGSIMQMASILPMVAPGGLTKILSIVPKIISGFTSMTKIITVVRSGLVLLTRAIPGAAVLAGIYALVKGFQAWRKSIEDAKKESVALNGISEKGAKELGISYTTLTEKLKAVREEQKLAADKAQSYFDSYTGAGNGLTLTIKQLKELKERVKSDMPETLEILNNIDSGQLNKWASNLKAQMVASGKTVEDTTNLIYALIESSNKAGMSIGAITDKVFLSIQGKSSAAALITKNLADNFDNINNIDGEAFASNLDTAVTSVNSAVDALVGTKNAQGEVINQAEALAEVYKELAENKTKDKKLSEDVLKVIQKQRPELAAILNQSDTIGSMIAKWRVYLSGVAIDLRNVTAEQAEMMAQFQSGLDAAAASAFDVNNNLSGMPQVASTLAKVNKDAAAAAKIAEKASKGEIGANKNLLKLYQDRIKSIRDTAEAKKRALRETFDQENAELELQQAKLDLQSAVARGDNEAAAAAQIRIQQIQKESSLKAAEAKIDANAKKAEEEQQKKYDAEKAKDDTATKVGNANSNRAKNLQGTSANITNLTNTYTGIASQLAQVNMFPQDSDEYKKGLANVKLNFSNFMKDLIDAANKDPLVAQAFTNLLKKDSKTGKFIEDPGFKLPKKGMVGSAFSDLQSLSGSMTAFSTQIMGGADGTLSNVIKTLKEGFKISAGKNSTPINASQVTSALEKNQPKSSVYLTDPTSRFSKEGYLEEGVKNALLADKSLKLELDKIYKIGNFNYRVAEDFLGKRTLVRQKARGGSIYGSQPYLVGERGPELFVPSSGGQIIPNNILGASYNIPSSTINGIGGTGGGSSNNIVYNIDIDLNGTNVTANDILRTFKAELALINAKEGRVRAFGGNY